MLYRKNFFFSYLAPNPVHEYWIANDLLINNLKNNRTLPRDLDVQFFFQLFPHHVKMVYVNNLKKVTKKEKQKILKENLHSIRFSYVFVLFLRFCFSLKKYALFHSHFYKSIYALSRLLYIDKNFVQKFCVWTIRAIFRNRAVPLYKKFFSEKFCPVGYVTGWLVRIWTHKNADEKAHTLSRRSKNVRKRTKTYKKRTLCKFTFTT